MDLAEFEKAIEENRRAVLAYAYTCSRDMDLAEDIVQETCLTALRKKDSYMPDANFTSWLISIARFIWFREREKRGIRDRAMKYLEDNAEELFTKDLYEEQKWQSEKKALTECMKKLPLSDRKIIDSHFIHLMKYEDIAKQMQRTLTWVKVRMHRLREALRKCIHGSLSENLDMEA